MVAQKRKVSDCKSLGFKMLMARAIDNCDDMERWLKLLELAFYEFPDSGPASAFSESSLELVMSTYLEKVAHLLQTTQDALKQARSINQSSSD